MTHCLLTRKRFLAGPTSFIFHVLWDFLPVEEGVVCFYR